MSLRSGNSTGRTLVARGDSGSWELEQVELRIRFQNVWPLGRDTGLWWDCQSECRPVASPASWKPWGHQTVRGSSGAQLARQKLHVLSWPSFGSHMGSLSMYSRVKAVTILVRFKGKRPRLHFHGSSIKGFIIILKNCQAKKSEFIKLFYFILHG